MTTRPTTEPPNWANGGSAVRTPPPSASKQLTGWLFKEPVPFNFLNWWWYSAWTWLTHFATSSSKRLSLHDAVENMAVGDTVIVDEYDADHFRGEQLIGIASGGASWLHVDVSGDGVFYFDSTGPLIGVKRSDLTTQYATAPYAAPTAAVARVLCDGEHLAITNGTEIKLYDAQAGGAVLWTYDHGATVNDIAMDGTHVYLVGDTSGGIELRAISIATGLAVWSYDHDGNLEAVATNGRQVFISGAASAHGSGAHMRAVIAATGADLANEGGLGLDASGMSWDVVDANRPAHAQGLATDGSGLLVCGLSAGAQRVQTRSVVDGSSIATGFTTASAIPRVTIDDRGIYATDTTGTPKGIIALERDTLALAWKGETDGLPFGVATDGAAVFACYTSTVAVQLEKIARGNRARLWRRVDPGDDYLPCRQLIVPED